jgi:hypothetical protein
MPSPREAVRTPLAGWRRVLFVACAACTLWLVVENSVLLVVLPRWWAAAHAVTTAEPRHE